MKKAFTLIELLIVVAIIAILAAIAVPNFLEAQTRSKVSRTKADLRTLSTGLETYAVDWNKYPYCNNFSLAGARPDQGETANANINSERRVLERLSTPTAYLSNGFLKDPFDPTTRRSSFSPGAHQGSASAIDNIPLPSFFKYAALSPTQTSGFADVEGLATDGPPKIWITIGAGPGRSYPAMGSLFTEPSNSDKPTLIAQFYDPTNGTVSYGYIFRTGGQGSASTAYAGGFLSVVGGK
jgi:prepilin-type N-terminal cleavage/methylation domain-containing protein